MPEFSQWAGLALVVAALTPTLLAGLLLAAARWPAEFPDDPEAE